MSRREHPARTPAREGPESAVTALVRPCSRPELL